MRQWSLTEPSAPLPGDRKHRGNFCPCPKGDIYLLKFYLALHSFVIRSRDDLLAEAEQERERVRMAESHLRRAHAALAEADSARQHIQNDLLSAQASAASNQQASEIITPL